MKNTSILKARGLLQLSRNIRHRHEEEVPLYHDDVFALDEDSRSEPLLDEAERRWVAKKLLRPADEILNDEFSTQEKLDICCEVWNLSTDYAFNAAVNQTERYRIMAAQLYHTVKFARGAWGMGNTVKAGEPDDNFDKVFYQYLRDAKNDDTPF